MTFDEALRIRNERCGLNDSRPMFIERHSFWWFAVPHIGGMGIIIDKADGHLQSLGTGAGLSRDEYFRLHECGFRHLSYSLHIVTIHNELEARRLLEETLEFRRVPKFDIQIDWTIYRHLQRIIDADCFDLRFTVTECDDETCRAIGSVIYESKRP